eukprot:XP_023157373.1 uncharacterized protein LOC103646187 isoform X2 [Zea mays]
MQSGSGSGRRRRSRSFLPVNARERRKRQGGGVGSTLESRQRPTSEGNFDPSSTSTGGPARPRLPACLPVPGASHPIFAWPRNSVGRTPIPEVGRFLNGPQILPRLLSSCLPLNVARRFSLFLGERVFQFLPCRPPRWWDRGRRQTDGGQRHAGHAAFGAAAISASAVAVHPLDTVKHSSSFQLGSGSWWTGSGRFWPCRFGRLLRDVGRKKIRRD